MSCLTARQFFETLNSGRTILFDGGMGSALYEQGYFIQRAFDEANLVSPEKVLKTHLSHLNAGAEVIETNTFSANRFLLGKYGIGDKVVDVNTAGVSLAQQAVKESGKQAWIAGSIGPTGEGMGVLTEEKEKEIREAFVEQAQALVGAGIEVFVLETFRLLQEIKIALEAVRSVCPNGVYITQMSFTEEGVLQDNSTPAEVAQLLAQWGAHMVGVNCGEGPAVVYKVAEAMVRSSPVPVCACPNAGHPSHLDNRTLYMATPEYFGVYGRRMLKAGVRAIGGCCGVGAAHLASLKGALKMMAGSAQHNNNNNNEDHSSSSESESSPPACLVTASAKSAKPENTLPPIPTAAKSKLAAKLMWIWENRLGRGTRRCSPKGPEDFVVSVEVNPSPGLNVDKRVAVAKRLRSAGVDVLNIADGPRAAVRMSNTALALQFQSKLDTEIILHVCCRDRNLLGLQSDILGYHVMGLHNLVIITGDPPKMGDYPKATAVFDLNSIELLRLVDGLNKGIDPAGKVVGEQTHFFLACGAEPGAVDYKRELNRLRQKVQAGAELIMTQPVYDCALVERFLDDIHDLNTPVLLGLCPLVSSRNAEFLHNEVPGMSVPASIRERMRKAGGGEGGVREGVQIAREMLDAFKDRVVGVYIMPQLGKFESALQTLEGLDYIPTIPLAPASSTTPSPSPSPSILKESKEGLLGDTSVADHSGGSEKLST